MLSINGCNKIVYEHLHFYFYCKIFIIKIENIIFYLEITNNHLNFYQKYSNTYYATHST